MPSQPAPERVLQRLDWHVVRRLDGLLQGEYRSLFRGPGVDLAGLRQYQPGDDVRYIDWNVTARTTEPYITIGSDDLLKEIETQPSDQGVYNTVIVIKDNPNEAPL